jgi:hypothetical protein
MNNSANLNEYNWIYVLFTYLKYLEASKFFVVGPPGSGDGLGRSIRAHMFIQTNLFLQGKEESIEFLNHPADFNEYLTDGIWRNSYDIQNYDKESIFKGLRFLKEEDVLKYEFYLRDYLTDLDSMLRDRAELKKNLMDSPAGKYLKKMEIHFEEAQKRKEAEQNLAHEKKLKRDKEATKDL